MMGLVFHRDSIKLSELSTDFALYPQIELSLCTFFDYGAEYLEQEVFMSARTPLRKDLLTRCLDLWTMVSLKDLIS